MPKPQLLNPNRNMCYHDPVWRSEIVTMVRLYPKLVRMLQTEDAISTWVETVRVCSSLRMCVNVAQVCFLSNLENVYILS